MKQFIKCQQCGSVELAVIIYLVHECTKCKYTIMHSEWNPIPALSIRQPWAWLVLKGYKPLENLNNLKNFRGTFLIHAGMKWDRTWFINQNDKLRDLLAGIPMPIKNKMNYGGIIGYATITGFIEKSDSPWFVGKYGLLIKNPKQLPFTPCKGKLSFFYPEIL